MKTEVRAFLIRILAGYLLLCCSTVSFAGFIRVGTVSLKNFGDAKAARPDTVAFIGERIAEIASLGVCVCDELQDSDGSAYAVLHAAVQQSAGVPIALVISAPVGGGRKESFGFFYNPALVFLLDARTFYFDEIERDPAVATFKCAEGFDFTLSSFHLRPDSQRDELRAELNAMADVFRVIQEADPLENDVILIGDFNAPPSMRPGQPLSMASTTMAGIPNFFAVNASEPTNVLQTKIYDNICFDAAETVEFIPGTAHVIDLRVFCDLFATHVPADREPVQWFNGNVLDHCPIFVDFNSDYDTD